MEGRELRPSPQRPGRLRPRGHRHRRAAQGFRPREVGSDRGRAATGARRAGPVPAVLVRGNHSDIGGSYEETESRLSDIALQWMLEQAVGVPDGLKVDGMPVVADPRHPVEVTRIPRLRLHPSAAGVQHCEVASMRDAIAARVSALGAGMGAPLGAGQDLGGQGPGHQARCHGAPERRRALPPRIGGPMRRGRALRPAGLRIMSGSGRSTEIRWRPPRSRRETVGTGAPRPGAGP